MKGLAPEKSKLRSDINVTPLIDVCLVLLIVFMVVTPLITSERREVELPPAENPDKQAEEPKPFPVWVVFADPPGILAGPDARRMDTREFFAALQVLHDSRPETRIAVRADHRLDYGQVKAVMRSIHEAGFTNIGLLAEKKKEKP